VDFTPPPPNSLRKIIHDLNGEIFLIRGYAELTLGLVLDDEAIRRHVLKILERTNELESIGKRLKERQRELEPG